MTDNLIKAYLKRINNKFVLERTDYESLLPRFDCSESIPKTISQICLRNEGESAEQVISTFDEGLKNNIVFLKNNNPDYTYNLYSDKEAERFILEHYGKSILEYFYRIDDHYGAARADFLRYLILYAAGGVYLDLKATVSIPLSNGIKEDDCFLVLYHDIIPDGNRYFLIPKELPYGELLTSLLVSSKGHPFLRQVIIQVLKNIDNYNPFTQGIGFSGVQRTTGNAMFSICINQSISKQKDIRYRYEKPYSNLGFKFYHSGKYIAGDYQKKNKLTDYRNQHRPVVKSNKKSIQLMNCLYFSLAHNLHLMFNKR